MAGAGVSLQSYVNGRLGGELGSAQTAAAINNVVGFGLLLVLLAASGAGRRGRAALRENRAAGRVRPWFFLGGACGALLVVTAATVAPEVGVALLTVALVLGQTSGSLAADAAGLSPAGRAAVTPPRLAGVALAVAAVAASALGSSGDPQLLLLALAVLAGALTAVQQAANGHLKQVSGEALLAGTINFAVGSTLLVLLALVVTGPVPPDGFGTSPWLWVGGALGAFSATTAALTVRALGTLRLTLAVVAGQSAGALVIDLVAPVSGEDVGVGTVLGVLLALAAVAVSLVRPRGARVPSAP